MKGFKLISTILIGLIVSGCASQSFKDADAENDKVHKKIASHTAPSEREQVKYIKKPPISITPITHNEYIPWLEDYVTINAGDTPLSMVLSHVLAGTNVHVDIDEAINPNTPITVSFNGRRGDVLNLIGREARASLVPHQDNLEVVKYISKSYELNIPTGRYSAQLGEQSTSGGSGDEDSPKTEGQFIKVSYDDISVLDDIANGIKAILKEEKTDRFSTTSNTFVTSNSDDEELVGDVQVVPSLSSISVKTTPERMRKVDRLIETYQHELSKQVMLNIQVIEFRSSEGTEHGIDWNVVRQTSEGALQFFVPGTTTISQSAGYGLAFMGTGKWDGTSTFIKVLEQQGKVSTETPVTALVLNNQPARISQALTKPYFSEIKSESNDSQISTSITRDKVVEGVDMMVTPNVKNQYVWLRISGKLTKIAGERTEVVEDTNLQLYDTRGSEISFTNKLRYGQTYVIASVKQSSTTSEGSKSFWTYLFGGTGTKKDTVETLVLLTPTRTES